MPLPAPFGVNCPQPESLRTGDLIFPRVSTLVEAGSPGKWIHTKSLGSQRMRVTVRARAPLLDAVISAANASQLLEGYVLNLPGSFQPPGGNLEAAGGASQYDLDDPRVLMFLYRVLQTALAGLVDDWLNMTIDDFIRSEIGRFLLKTLTDKSPQTSFFVGHMAMVIRERDGVVVGGSEGTPYVIEANITDYSHYRVAVHPYAMADDPAPTPAAEPLMRGWANRRLARQEKIWLARPTALPAGDAPDSASQLTLKQTLAAQAKALHGRPYGFFDNPTFGDPDRMYCSEFVFNVFRSAGGISIADHQSWGWVARYLAVSGQTALADLVNKVRVASGFEESRPFFVLTPPMVWSSAAVQQTWNPAGEPGYSPDVA